MSRISKSRTLVLSLLLLGTFGCSSSRAPSRRSSRVKKRPKPPPKIALTKLPRHGPERKGYDVSAPCILFSLRGDDDPVARAIGERLRSGLRKRGYKVVEWGAVPVAEERAKCRKVIEFGRYAARSARLPGSKRVGDVAVFVDVLNRPGSKPLSVPSARREFVAWGRDESFVPDLGDETSVRAVRSAVDDLFAIDGFRRALEP